MNETNLKARDAALRARDDYPAKPTSLVSYQSAGRVAVITNPDDWKALGDLPAPLQPIGLISASPRDVAGWNNAIAIAGRDIELSGHLGAFQVKLVDASGQAESVAADIVLDLADDPLCSQELPPPGYLRVNLANTPGTELQEELLGMTGQFEKPRYFNYQADICAHGVNGASVCTRCIDACPADAISSIGAKIEVDPFLCQGGGICASVCPSGAIQYALPRLGDQGNRVRLMLKAYREQGGAQPVLVFHAEALALDNRLREQANVLPLAVEEIASVGVELCLSALVYGAQQVVLMVDPEAPASAVNRLRQQLEWAHEVMSGLGLKRDQIALVEDAQAVPQVSGEPQFEPAPYSMPDSKRQAVYQAVDHLYQQVERTREMIDLPAGAPFGTANIDASACTLCMACVGACPGRALQDGSNREVPEVFFIESNCLQCGACTLTCPENAISISPRLIFEREKRNRSRMLHQDTPFACISCGKAFAPTSVIHKMSFRLQGHHMFQSGRALDRLKMCEDCRVADIVQDEDAMNGQFDPLAKASRDFLS